MIDLNTTFNVKVTFERTFYLVIGAIGLGICVAIMLVALIKK
jgi:hypothetical protein